MKISFEEELNEQQYTAVTSSRKPGKHALVIAGAGSGKTRTLTYRVAWLIEQGVAARDILLLTFTNKAAAEMLERVGELIGSHEVAGLWGGTFHSVGNRILRRHFDLVGLRQNFSIMDREDQKTLLENIIKDAKIDVKELQFPKPKVLADLFSYCVNTKRDLSSVMEERYTYFEDILPLIEDVYARYEARKKDLNAVDFDDLLCLCLKLFSENKEILAHYQKRFSYILVDEYQDTNKVQAEMIHYLCGKEGNLMVVGDDAQSIYSWRGAHFANILNFDEQYGQASSYQIETNYRSVPEVLELANCSIALNDRQLPKNLKPNRDSAGEKPGLISMYDVGTQASYVAQEIHDLVANGMPPKEIAVLYRSHFHSMEIQMELTRSGLPFYITSGLRFFEQRHIKDVGALLKFASNPRDEVAFGRMSKLLPGVGPASAAKLWRSWLEALAELGDRRPETYSEIMLKFSVPKKAIKSWEQLCYTLDEFLDEDSEDGLKAPVEMIASVMGGMYESYMIEEFHDFEQRKQDLDQFSRYSTNFTKVDELLSELALLSTVDEEGLKEEKEQNSNSLTLSSIHQAKGLEWKVVFLVWLCEGMFPSAKTVDGGDLDALEEERRLFYVAVTRAKDRLYLLHPEKSSTRYSGDVYQVPSRFLEELEPELVEEYSVGVSY